MHGSSERALRWLAALCLLAADAASAQPALRVASLRVEGSAARLDFLRPADWEGPGDYLAIEVRFDDGRRVRLSGLEGMPWVADGISLWSAARADFPLVRVLARRAQPPLLLLRDWEYGSSPGRVRGIQVAGGQVQLQFDELLWIERLQAVDGDWEIAGRRCTQSPEDPPSYAPRLVWRRAPAEAAYRLDLALSEARTRQQQRVWAGPDCGDLAIVRDPDGRFELLPRAQAMAALAEGRALLPRRNADGSLW